MGDAEHTPGPWKVGYAALDVLAPSEKGGNFKLCDIRGWGYLTGGGDGALGLSQEEAVQIQTANARLIAAAPDLLAALKSLLSEWDALGNGDDEGNPIPDNAPCAVKARAAIAKAEPAP